MPDKKTKLELTWIGKENRPRLEPCILLEQPELSYNSPRQVTPADRTDNLLIHGDNLLALRSLEKTFSGAVKCVYIDPPYNTGYAFEHYDDGVEHSLWLTLMRDRLEHLRALLTDDGVLVAQIGFDEMAYLKILLDEVFGRNNCIGQVAVRMSHSAGMKRIAKDRRLIKNTEYLLVYFKDQQPTLYPRYEKVTEYPVNYYQWIEEFPKDSKPGRYGPLPLEVQRRFPALFTKYGLKVTNKSIGVLFQREDAVQRFLIDNRDRVARKHGEIPALDQDFSHLDPNEFVRVDTDSRYYFMGHGDNGADYQVIPLSEKVQPVSYADEEGVVHQEHVIANLLGDWWDGFWRDMSRVDVEGGVLMKESKKPERLLQWIIELTTRPGDLILDSFLGSGTTAAVAHKLHRRWIGVELGDHCEQLAAVRLRKVIDGQDKNGITAAVGWKGGGGFRFYRLAPSLLARDKWGNYVISDTYRKGPDAGVRLAEAMCKLEGFTYAPSSTTFWMHGTSTEQDFIYVTTQTLTHDQLAAISEEVGPERTLLICCGAFVGKPDQLQNLTVKKIPAAVLTRCEWGKDDYSLNVAAVTGEEPPEPEPAGTAAPASGRAGVATSSSTPTGWRRW